VPSYQRPEALIPCLDGLLAGSRLPDQVVVVLRDTDEQSHEAFDEWFAARPDEHARLIEQVDVSPPGQMAATNAGLARATGDVVCFIDDDCVATEQWLERVLSHYADPDVVGVGGRDIVHHGDAVEYDPRKTVGLLTGYGMLVGQHHQPGFDEPVAVDHLKGANMSYRREAVSGFDTNIMGAHFSDTDASLTARATGGVLIYDPQAAVHHYPAPRQGGFDRKSETPNELFVDAHDWAYVMLKHLAPHHRPGFWLFALLVGQDRRYGLARMLAKLPFEGGRAIQRWRSTLQGLREARRTLRLAGRTGPSAPPGGDGRDD
jgi:GT2 family glycosyltransferase